jgi:GNAT superfamily N-acetyltransferase
LRLFRSAPRVLPAQPAEADALADLYRLAWSGCERLLDPRLLTDQVPAVDEVRSWFRGGFEVYRIRQEGPLIGAVRCCFPSSACYIDRLVVDPGWAGRGIGHLLVSHAVSRARRAGVSRVWAQASPKLAAARALFRSIGFREASHIQARYWGEELVLLELPV